MAESYVEKLIDLVHSNIHLFDPRHPDYKDVYKKAATWEEISKKLNLRSDVVKTKWKNLRDSYLRYLKFTKGETGSGKKYQNWPWAGHLEFLNDSLEPRPTVSNIDELSGDNEMSPENMEEEAPSLQMPPPPPQNKKRKRSCDDIQSVLHYLSNKKPSLDRIDHLFLSYADTFKKFSKKTQVELKMELAQLFGRAELRDLEDQKKEVSHHTSFPSPSSSSQSSFSSNINSEKEGTEEVFPNLVREFYEHAVFYVESDTDKSIP